jgi:hypothetical protein
MDWRASRISRSNTTIESRLRSRAAGALLRRFQSFDDDDEPVVGRVLRPGDSVTYLQLRFSEDIADGWSKLELVGREKRSESRPITHVTAGYAAPRLLPPYAGYNVSNPSEKTRSRGIVTLMACRLVESGIHKFPSLSASTVPHEESMGNRVKAP